MCHHVLTKKEIVDIIEILGRQKIAMQEIDDRSPRFAKLQQTTQRLLNQLNTWVGKGGAI